MDMDQPYVGEIRLFAGNFAPLGWMFCEGQTLPISENEVLFQLIGTTYGGDGEETFNLPNLASRVPLHMGTGPDGTTYGGNGTTNFALPNLQGRVPLHVGSGHTLGERAGESSHTLVQSEMPTHTHVYNASSASDRTNPNPNTTDPTNAEFADTQAKVYHPADANMVALGPSTISTVGGSQPHENTQPFLTLSFCIALQGIFPSPT